MFSSVTVDRERLLATLKENLKTHVVEYDEAVIAYREEASKALRRRANEIKGGDSLDPNIDLPRPQSYAADYERAISMVEWSVESEVVLDEHEFRCYVLDEWAWKSSFASNTRSYLAGAKAAR